MKTSELTGALLDYWVARAEGLDAMIVHSSEQKAKSVCVIPGPFGRTQYLPSVDWAQGGPLIDKYKFDIFNGVDKPGDPEWKVCDGAEVYETGATALEAICRAVVRAKFGGEVPDQSEKENG